MSAREDVHIPTDDEIYDICVSAYDYVRNNKTPDADVLHRLNITLLQRAQKHLQNPLDIKRSQRTIAHLQTLLGGTA